MTHPWSRRGAGPQLAAHHAWNRGAIRTPPEADLAAGQRRVLARSGKARQKTPATNRLESVCSHAPRSHFPVARGSGGPLGGEAVGVP
jgi:hypothetical protein